MMYAIGMKGGPLMDPQSHIRDLKRQLLALGPLLPGSISEQWNVCGTPGCACKAARNPRKHGPYYQLSFSVQGKSSSMFVRRDQVAEARRRIARYQRFKALCFRLVAAYVQLARTQGLAGR